MDDPSGHAARARTEIPVRPAGNLIGIKPAVRGWRRGRGRRSCVRDRGGVAGRRPNRRCPRGCDCCASGRTGGWSCTAAWPGMRRSGATSRWRRNRSRSRPASPCVTRSVSISAATGLRSPKRTGSPPPPSASARGGSLRRIRTCRIRWTFPPTARSTRPARLRASTSPRPSAARRPSSCSPTGCTCCARFPSPRAGRMWRCRSARIGGRGPMSRSTSTAPLPIRNPAGPAGRSASPGSASIPPAASSRWRSRRRRNIRHARKPLFPCAPRLAPGSALRRWMRASFG